MVTTFGFTLAFILNNRAPEVQFSVATMWGPVESLIAAWYHVWHLDISVLMIITFKYTR